MKNDIADKWIAALRSGQYTQAKGVLKKGNSHCCLGVLCELYLQEHPEARWVQDGPLNHFFANSEDCNHSLLPNAVRDWAGMRTKDGLMPGSSLSIKNDAGYTFNGIASIIDKYKDVL